MIIVDCKQGTPEWDECRLGIPTASEFFRIVTPKGKLVSPDARKKYLYELAGEFVSGRREENFQSFRMKEGSRLEEESRQVYAMEHEVEVVQVGFVFKDEQKKFGCSPDGLIDPNGGFETKDAKFSIHIDRLVDGKMVTEHIPQVQGSLYVTGREWWDFQSYCNGLPELCIRNYRDEKYISLLAEELDRFCLDLAMLIGKLKRM